MTYDGDAVSFAADVYTANQEVRRERESVKYWRTEYARVQRERDEARMALGKIALGDPEALKIVRGMQDEMKAIQPQREGDYL